MKNPSWRAEDGQLLRSLREEAGIDALVFARNNTVSLAQLKELELGGNSSFYNPDIKRSTGVKLLKKLGHERVIPEPLNVAIESTEPTEIGQPLALVNGAIPALVSPHKAPANSPHRRLIQQSFWGSLGLLGLVGLTAMKPWGLVDASARDPRSVNLATHASVPMVASTPDHTPVAQVTQEHPSFTTSAKLNALPTTPLEPSVAKALVKSSTPASACDWVHRSNSKIHTPVQPLKPGNYVHLEAQADTELCVLDSQNQRTLLQLKAGMAQSVYGSAPFLVHSQNLHTLKLFFQGRRVHEPLSDLQYVLLNSQPL
jgi:hypothetical protein